MGRAPPFPGFTGWGGHIQTFSRQSVPGKMSEFSGSGLSGLGNIDCRWPNRGLFVFYVLQNWNHNTLGLVPVFSGSVRLGVSIPALQFLFVKSIFLCCLAFACPRVAGWLGKGKEIQISRFNPKASGGPRSLPTAADHGTTRLWSKHSYAKKTQTKFTSVDSS